MIHQISAQAVSGHGVKTQVRPTSPAVQAAELPKSKKKKSSRKGKRNVAASTPTPPTTSTVTGTAPAVDVNKACQYT
jgi:hypothetical protein